MDKTLCQRCFHYAACKEIDLSGFIGDPVMENNHCDHFIDSERVKIQDKANWIEKIHSYSDNVHVCYYCSSCNRLEKVKGYTKTEWSDYYSEHYRGSIELPNFCCACGSAIAGVVEDPCD